MTPADLGVQDVDEMPQWRGGCVWILDISELESFDDLIREGAMAWVREIVSCGLPIAAVQRSFIKASKYSIYVPSWLGYAINHVGGLRKPPVTLKSFMDSRLLTAYLSAFAMGCENEFLSDSGLGVSREDHGFGHLFLPGEP